MVQEAGFRESTVAKLDLELTLRNRLEVRKPP